MFRNIARDLLLPLPSLCLRVNNKFSNEIRDSLKLALTENEDNLDLNHFLELFKEYKGNLVEKPKTF